MTKVTKKPLNELFGQCTADGSFSYVPKQNVTADEIREGERSGQRVEVPKARAGAEAKVLDEPALVAIRLFSDPTFSNYGDSDEEQAVAKFSRDALKFSKLEQFFPEGLVKDKEGDEAQKLVDERLKQLGFAQGAFKADDLPRLRAAFQSIRAYATMIQSARSGSFPPADKWMQFETLSQGDAESNLRVFHESISHYAQMGEICTIPGNNGVPIVVSTQGAIGHLVPFFLEMLPINFSSGELREFLATYRLVAKRDGLGSAIPVYEEPKLQGSGSTNGDISTTGLPTMPPLEELTRIYMPGGAYLEDYAVLYKALSGLEAEKNSHEYLFSSLREGQMQSTWNVSPKKIKESNSSENRRVLWVHSALLTQEKLTVALGRLQGLLGERAKTPRGMAMIRSLRESALQAEQVKFDTIEQYVNESLNRKGFVEIGALQVTGEELSNIRYQLHNKLLPSTETFSTKSDIREQERTAGVSEDVALILLLAFRKSGQQGSLRIPDSYSGRYPTQVALRFRETEVEESFMSSIGDGLWTFVRPWTWLDDDAPAYDGVQPSGTLAAVAGSLMARIRLEDPQNANRNSPEWTVLNELKARGEQAVSRIENDELREEAEFAQNIGIGVGAVSTLGFVAAMMFPDQTRSFLRTVINPLRWKRVATFTIPQLVRRAAGGVGAWVDRKRGTTGDRRFTLLEVEGPEDPDRGPGGGKRTLRQRMSDARNAFRGNHAAAPSPMPKGDSSTRGSQQARAPRASASLWNAAETEGSRVHERAPRDSARAKRMRANTRSATRLGSGNGVPGRGGRPIATAADRARARTQAPRPVLEGARKGGRR